MIAAGNKPDLIIVDYADLLLSHSNKTDSTYAEQGGVYIDLRGMSGELQIPIWTASQTNRSAIDSEVIEADKIADSYAKVMNADFIMSLSRKAKDKLKDEHELLLIEKHALEDQLSKVRLNAENDQTYVTNLYSQKTENFADRLRK